MKGNRYVLGITGGIASGKTTVLKIIASRGIPTISADDLAHDCIRRGRPGYRSILRKFGRDIVGRGEEIDRKKLGQIVFQNPAKRKQLEKIVHPCVAKGLRRFIRTHKGLMALDIPLLFEAKYQNWVDKIVVVWATREQQIKRFMSRTGLSRAKTLQRLRSQIPLSQKRKKADFTLMNTRDRAALARQTRQMLRFL